MRYCSREKAKNMNIRDVSYFCQILPECFACVQKACSHVLVHKKYTISFLQLHDKYIVELALIFVSDFRLSD